MPAPSEAPVENKPKPCCVCKEEKQRRDECMLFSEKGEEDCKPVIEQYKTCMAGFGFKI
ncbi:telomere binding protein [Saitoella coloradoensis]